MITNQGGRAWRAAGTAAGGGRGVQRGSCNNTAGDSAARTDEERASSTTGGGHASRSQRAAGLRASGATSREGSHERSGMGDGGVPGAEDTAGLARWIGDNDLPGAGADLTVEMIAGGRS